MSAKMVPELLWAQRSNATIPEKNLLYLTVKLPDLLNEEIKLTSTSFSFSGTSQGQEYAISFEWFDEIDVDKSKQAHTTGQGIFLELRKKNPQEEFWPRLSKDKVRRPNVRTDFDKWVDEDEQDEVEEPEADPGMGGMPFGAGGETDQMAQLQAMLGGQGGAGGQADQMAQLQAMLGGQGGAGGFDMASLMSGQGIPDDADEIEEAAEDEPEESKIQEIK